VTSTTAGREASATRAPGAVPVALVATAAVTFGASVWLDLATTDAERTAAASLGSKGAADRASYPAMSRTTRDALTEQYAESNARLAAFLGRDLSAWQRG
jgi:hypothetical protein